VTVSNDYTGDQFCGKNVTKEVGIYKGFLVFDKVNDKKTIIFLLIVEENIFKINIVGSTIKKAIGVEELKTIYGSIKNCLNQKDYYSVIADTCTTIKWIYEVRDYYDSDDDENSLVEEGRSSQDSGSSRSGDVAQEDHFEERNVEELLRKQEITRDIKILSKKIYGKNPNFFNANENEIIIEENYLDIKNPKYNLNKA